MAKLSNSPESVSGFITTRFLVTQFFNVNSHFIICIYIFYHSRALLYRNPFNENLG